MKILFLTQYFPPEIGAPQNRLFELAVRLQKSGIQVDVFTAMPNYPQMKVYDNYRNIYFLKEEIEGIDVFRSWIYASTKKSVVFRLLNYFSFVFSSLFFGLFKLKKYDFIFCESPPLFLGISAYLLCKFKSARLIFNVSDLWPESAEKLGIIRNTFFLGLATKLEEFLYRKSVLITGQTQGIVKNISERFPKKKVYWLPNGVDLSYYDPNNYTASWRTEHGFSLEDTLLAYAGIIGHAQGLEVIIKAAKLLGHEKNLKFILMGSGPEKDNLIYLNTSLGNENVIFLDPITKKEMPHFVKSIDASIIPLKNLLLFEGAIPSKIFENLAMEKPIILGVKGEAKTLFIDEGKAGIAFEPENEISLAEGIKELLLNRGKFIEMGINGRKYADLKFNRNNIAADFASQLRSLK